MEKDFIKFDEDLNDGFRLHYEDFIDFKITELGQYLSLHLSPNREIEDCYAHVPRSKTYGNWKNWFTPTDVEIFKDLFDSYLLKYGYNRDWTLNEDPYINPDHSSRYVERVVSRKVYLNHRK